MYFDQPNGLNKKVRHEHFGRWALSSAKTLAVSVTFNNKTQHARFTVFALFAAVWKSTAKKRSGAKFLHDNLASIELAAQNSIRVNNQWKFSPPLVSVILPVHNAVGYIHQAINSILSQTYSNFELIVINDSSTDGTTEILDSLTDSRVVVIRFDKNQGIVSGLNAGIGKARGKYLARMDADDIATPNRLELQVAYLEQRPEVGVVGSWIKGFGNVRRPYIHRYPESFQAIKSLLLFDTPLAHPSVMIRRTALETVGAAYSDDFPYVEDWELWRRLAEVTQIANIGKPLLHYRIHAKSSSHTFNQIQSDSKRNLLKSIYDAKGLPFNERILIGPVLQSAKDLKECYGYFMELATKVELTKQFNPRVFRNVLQNQMLIRLRQMSRIGGYPAYFLLRYRIADQSVFSFIGPALRVIVLTNLRALRDTFLKLTIQYR